MNLLDLISRMCGVRRELPLSSRVDISAPSKWLGSPHVRPFAWLPPPCPMVVYNTLSLCVRPSREVFSIFLIHVSLAAAHSSLSFLVMYLHAVTDRLSPHKPILAPE